MKKFQFTLEKLRDYKGQLFENEKGKLMKLIAERDACLARIDALEQDFLRLHGELSEKMKSGINARHVQLFEFRKNNVREEQAQMRVQVNILEGAIERQRRVVVALSQEIESLNKLEEKKLEEYNDKVNKENEMLISEFIVSSLARQNAS